MAGKIDADWRVGPGDIREYWSWTAGALYLLLSVDLLTTLYAVKLYGPGAEANPYVRYALTQGLPTLVVLNLVALLVIVGLLYGYMNLLRTVRGVEAWIMARSFELWVGVLLTTGLFVFANNLSVIVLGGSLL